MLIHLWKTIKNESSTIRINLHLNKISERIEIMISTECGTKGITYSSKNGYDENTTINESILFNT